MSTTTESDRAGEASIPRVKFLSLFVADLESARLIYEQVLGAKPVLPREAIARHPFAASEPVVFDLGGVELVLYQCDMRATHPGDVGIGLRVQGSPAHISSRVPSQGGRVFWGPAKPESDRREMAVFVLPDRHFFEVVGSSDG